jgi:hypothetical protein
MYLNRFARQDSQFPQERIHLGLGPVMWEIVDAGIEYISFAVPTGALSTGLIVGFKYCCVKAVALSVNSGCQTTHAGPNDNYGFIHVHAPLCNYYLPPFIQATGACRWEYSRARQSKSIITLPLSVLKRSSFRLFSLWLNCLSFRRFCF